MRRGILFLASLLAVLGPVLAGAAGERDERLFPRPAALEPQIRFWKAIFAEYSTHQTVLHDALHLDKIYKVLDFRGLREQGLSTETIEQIRRSETDLELERMRATLRRLHEVGADREALSAEERRIHDLHAQDPSPDRFLEAAGSKRLRSQRGLRERFAEAIRVSRRYLPEMERTFREQGLPVELTRLPLIESSFDLQAYSKVGAAGIWQFMPATGRRFMRVDHVVDERRDPLTSTRAAARYLNELHDALGSWPLAITGYNHGPQGISRAVENVGSTDIVTIIRHYRGSAFGFASRNFYPEFLAALEIDADQRTHFGEIAPEPPLEATEIRLERAVGLEQAATLARCPSGDLVSLNPALSSTVVSGRHPIPAGYRLRLPGAGVDDFEARLAELPEPRVVRVVARRTERGRGRSGGASYVTHRVRPGQTLSGIARKHGVSVAALRSANRLGRKGHVRAGQTLRIPSAANEA